MTLSITMLCYCAECRIFFIIVLSVIMPNDVMLSVIYAECHLRLVSFMLSVIYMLSVILAECCLY